MKRLFLILIFLSSTACLKRQAHWLDCQVTSNELWGAAETLELGIIYFTNTDPAIAEELRDMQARIREISERIYRERGGE